MREVDGFTLIDYIKSSIEILMNMKIEDGNEPGNPHPFVAGDEDFDEDEEEREERRRRKKEKKEAKKLAAMKAEPKAAEEKKEQAPKRVIPKIDNHTPTSSIIDL
jgi:hypothetical protein